MRQLLLGFVLLSAVWQSGQAQIVDTGTLRTYINAHIISNGNRAITAQQLNAVLNGFLNVWPATATKPRIDTLLPVNGAITWDYSVSTFTEVNISANTSLNILNVSAGQKGTIIVSADTGMTILYPRNSYKAAPDIYDSYNSIPDTDNTRVGYFVDGTPVSGIWICDFLFDGTNFYWTIKRVTMAITGSAH